MLIDRGVLRATDASRWEVAGTIGDVDVPRSIQGLIAARLDSLPDDEKLVLQDAAVVGREFWLGSVVELSGLDLTAAREVLGRLRVKELIVPHETSSFSGQAEFSFRHLLLRDGAYDSLPKQLRAEKHAGVAAWAAERAGNRADEMAELIASHALAALRYRQELGETGSPLGAAMESAYRWTRAAGDRTAAVWLRAEAIRWYAEASRLGEIVEASVADRLTLARAYVEAAWGTAPLEEDERVCRHMGALAELANDPYAAGFAHTKLVRVLFDLGRDEEAEAEAKAAIELLEPLGNSVELADALRSLGWYRWRRGHASGAEPVLRRAIEIATDVDAPIILAEATMDLGVTLAIKERTEECVSTMEAAYRLAKECGDFNVLMRVYINYPAAALFWTSDFAGIRRVTAEGVELARKAGATHMLAWLLGNLSDNTAMELGPLDEARDMALEAVELAEAAGDEPVLGMRLAGLGIILAERGETDEALLALERARDVQIEPEPQAEVLLEIGFGLLATQQGHLDVAITHLRSASDVNGLRLEQRVEVYAPLVRALLALGDLEAAQSYNFLTGRAITPLGKALGRVIDGLLESDPAAAIDALTEAVARLGDIPARPEQGRALLDLAKAQVRCRIDPSPTLAQAREIFTTSQALAWIPHVDALELELADAAGGTA